MFARLRSPISIAASLVAVVTLAVSAAASPASAITVAPHQYFFGKVYGLNGVQNVITVACAGPEAYGHPFANQYVEVQVPVPGTTTVGYTGDSAKQIDADLTWGLSNPVSVAIFTTYFVREQIPTGILVPCGGAGQMSFNPDPDVAGTSSIVNVTFISPGA